MQYRIHKLKRNLKTAPLGQGRSIAQLLPSLMDTRLQGNPSSGKRIRIVLKPKMCVGIRAPFRFVALLLAAGVLCLRLFFLVRARLSTCICGSGWWFCVRSTRSRGSISQLFVVALRCPVLTSLMPPPGPLKECDKEFRSLGFIKEFYHSCLTFDSLSAAIGVIIRIIASNVFAMEQSQIPNRCTGLFVFLCKDEGPRGPEGCSHENRGQKERFRCGCLVTKSAGFQFVDPAEKCESFECASPRESTAQDSGKPVTGSCVSVSTATCTCNRAIVSQRYFRRIT
eukprot:1187918-Rhodomonas_salina.2